MRLNSLPFFFVCIFLFTYPAGAQAYVLKPVLIQVFSANQPDTMGFNLAKSLPAFFYKKIIDGELKLYDSPGKKHTISPEVLQQIEKSNNCSATKLKSIFIHEFWTRKKNRIDIFPVGITLSDYDMTGNVVSFGYIDLEEAFDMLSTESIETNPNGPYPLTCWEAIKSRRFIFQLAQFGNKVFHDHLLAEQMLKKNLKNAWISGVPEFTDSKLVTYTIDGNIQNNKNAEMVNKLEQLLRNTKDLRDSACYPVAVKDPYKDIRITRIVVKEIWKRKDGFFEYAPVSFIAYNQDTALNEIQFSDFMFTDFKLFENDISSKYFELIITMVNSQPIKQSESLKYINALRSNTPWTQVTNYIKTN